MNKYMQALPADYARCEGHTIGVDGQLVCERRDTCRRHTDLAPERMGQRSHVLAYLCLGGNDAYLPTEP